MAFADGDDITQDYQFELSIDGVSDFVFGAGANGIWLDFYKTAPTNLFGYGDAKTQDVDIAGSNGSFANGDYQSVRQISIPVLLRNAATEATLFANLAALEAVWAPLAVDAQLAFQWPSISLHWYMGRPRAMAVDVSLQRRGVIRALLRFDCLDPALAGP